MTDYEKARLNMIEGQVRTNDVSDKALQAAMAELPRERFVSPDDESLAYSDVNLEIGNGRFLMRPRAFSKLMQAARPVAGDLVLIVGCGTGYSAAVAGKLVDSVIALESDEELAARATAILGELEIDNVAVVTGPLSEGLTDQGPFDVVFVDGALPERSEALEAQLADGGRMAAVYADGPIGRGTITTRDGDRAAEITHFDASVPLLPGFERESEFVF